jgi:hypothetical protein
MVTFMNCCFHCVNETTLFFTGCGREVVRGPSRAINDVTKSVYIRDGRVRVSARWCWMFVNAVLQNDCQTDEVHWSTRVCILKININVQFLKLEFKPRVIQSSGARSP